MTTARLIPAHEWQCNNCGTRNYVSAIDVTEQLVADPATREHHPELFDDEGQMTAECFMAPSHVVCSACREKFETEQDGEEDEVE